MVRQSQPAFGFQHHFAETTLDSLSVGVGVGVGGYSCRQLFDTLWRIISQKNCKEGSEHIRILSFADDKLGTIAGACQPSRWAVTLMDVHSMGKGVFWGAIKNSNRY